MTVKMTRLSAAILTALAGTAHADSQKHHFDIPAQPLGSALQTLAAQSGAQMFYAEQTAAGKKSPRLSGDYTTAEAADKLLAGSGLVHSVAENGTVTVKPAPQSEGVATLKPMTVVGKVGADQDDGKSYVATSTKSATKTDTPIMQTPQSIQVIKRSVIDDQQNVTVSESLRNVSGVVANNPLFTPANEATRIRGFVAEQMIDGFTQYRNAGDRESTVNIERIEVLKGSNGVLYSGGSGSPVGGLVNIVSKLPKADASRELGFKIGTNNYYQPYLDINQPLTKNILTRFTGEYTDAGSYLDVVKTQRYNLNPTLTFTNNDSTTFTVQGKVSRWQQPEYQGLPATGTVAGNGRLPTARNTFVGNGSIPDSFSEFYGVWGTLDHKFNETWSLNLKARHAKSEFDEKVQTLYGADGFAADRPFFANTWALYNAELSQKQDELSFLGNLTAKFDAGPTKNTVLIGADHSDLEDKGFMDVNMGRAGTVDLSNPVFTAAYGPAGAGIDNMFVTNTTYGGYTQLQSTLYDRLHLLTSLRAGVVGIDYKNDTRGTQSYGEKTKFLPRAGAVFDLTDEYSLFVNYSEGMRGQPFLNFVGAPQPEESTTLEGGLKFNIAHQLSGQIAGYQIDRTHVAVTDNTDVLRRSKAAGQQRSRGIETDLTWQATDALSILANYAHTDARFTDNLAGVPEGNKLALVPEHSGRLWANYRFQQPMLKGFSIGGGIYAQGQAYLSNNNQFKADGYHTFDASLAYELKQFKLAATVKNLTDEHYYQAYGYFDGRVMPSEGTSAYVTASVKF